MPENTRLHCWATLSGCTCTHFPHGTPGKLALCSSPLAHADGRQASTTQACRLRPFIVDEQRGEINQAIADSANIVGLTIPLLQGSRFEAPCITEGDGLMSAKKVCDKRQMENRGENVMRCIEQGMGVHSRATLCKSKSRHLVTYL